MRCDPGWRKFAEMVGSAAYWVKTRGVTTVLGGMMPVDPHWLETMKRHGALDYIDVIGIHGFPGMWWNDQPNWDWHSQLVRVGELNHRLETGGWRTSYLDYRNRLGNMPPR